MSNTPPFIDWAGGELDTDQILEEAIPLTALIVLFAGLAFIPFFFVVLFAGSSTLGALLMFISQIIIAIGAGIVLMYVITRSIQIARPDES